MPSRYETAWLGDTTPLDKHAVDALQARYGRVDRARCTLYFWVPRTVRYVACDSPWRLRTLRQELIHDLNLIDRGQVDVVARLALRDLLKRIGGVWFVGQTDLRGFPHECVL